MKNQFCKIFNLAILFSLNYICSFGQTEYIINVNPTTGAFSKIDSLPGVKWITLQPHYTTFDDLNHRYIFRGGDNSGNWYLYSVDANTGNIISSPPFPLLTDPMDNVIELQFDNSSSTLYGLHWDNSENTEYFVSIDPATGVFTKINSLPGVMWITTLPNFTTFDEINHRFIFNGGDVNGNSFLYSIDANTGNILTSPQFPILTDLNDNVIELQYDNSSSTLFGLHWDNSEYREYFVSVDPSTGTLTKIDSLPGVYWITNSPNYTTFDEINHRYVFKGGDNSGNWFIYSVDANTGNILSSPPFPLFADPMDNIIEFQFDNSSGNLYALNWETNTSVGIANNEIKNHSLNSYPNPFSYSTKINLDKSYREITIFLYNSTKQLVRSETYLNTSSIEIPKGSLLNGIYFISVICDHQQIGTQKIIIE